jgi:type IV fimbrial biogenesis protein FimT
MKPMPHFRRNTRGLRGITIIELMVVVAIVAVISVLVAPSFSDMIVMQRLRGVNAQLVTDIQLARSEAVARGMYAGVNFSSDSSQTCYVIYAANDLTTPCNCLLGAGSACSSAGAVAANAVEVKTVSVPISSQVTVQGPDPAATPMGFDSATGGLKQLTGDSGAIALAAATLKVRVDDGRWLWNTVNATGRVTVCAPSSSAPRMGVPEASGASSC